MTAAPLVSDSLPKFGASQLIDCSRLDIKLTYRPKKFYRHGWQSWTLSTWLDPNQPPLPVRAAEFRMKDEDPGYALHKNHIGAWVGAVELGEDDVLLLGALALSGRVELDGRVLRGFYETDGLNAKTPSGWFLARGKEDNVFSMYTDLLANRFGKGRFPTPPRVWCSWYSFYRWVNERVVLKALRGFDGMPFDVFQLDDGWQMNCGDWEANKKFPSGMKALADKISATGRTAGIWLAPFMVSPDSQLAKKHPDWLLRDHAEKLVHAGITWSGNPLCLDVSQPAVLEWLDRLIRKVRGWGFGYLKLDFLSVGALVGKRYSNLPREAAYRHAMQVMRDAAGDAYILACGAPILPSLGLCDGLRVGPDVSPYWLNKFLTVWLNNPNDTSTQNAIRTSIHRLWLKPLVNVDPDVMFFRSRHNTLQSDESQLLQHLITISGFKATSDPPQWMTGAEKNRLQAFLESNPKVEKLSRYRYQLDNCAVDFSPALPIQATDRKIPIWLAKYLGLVKIARQQALPAIFESLKL